MASKPMKRLSKVPHRRCADCKKERPILAATAKTDYDLICFSCAGKRKRAAEREAVSLRMRAVAGE